ncbi:MAG: hypothetical protein QM775_16630 [Pirellulales bacterium]
MAGWSREAYMVMTRGGLRQEILWYNFGDAAGSQLARAATHRSQTEAVGG